MKVHICKEYLMADGAAAITKSKMEVRKPKDDAVKVLGDGSEVDKQRGMCYPHVQRNIHSHSITILPPLPLLDKDC